MNASMSCDVNLCLIEWKLRCAQAHDGLQELRQHLQLKCHLTGFKKSWLTGQWAHTRSRAVIDTVAVKVAAAAIKYHMAWWGLDALANVLLWPDWQNEFPKLRDKDICGITEVQAGGMESEG